MKLARIDKYCLAINKTTEPVAAPGHWDTVLFKADIPGTLRGISWDLSLYNAIAETPQYTGEIVNWMLYVRRDYPGAPAVPPAIVYPSPVDGDNVFGGPPQDLITTGWIIVDRTVSNVVNPHGPYILSLSGGGGILVAGDGEITSISGSLLDAGGQGFIFPPGGGSTITRQTGETKTMRKMKVGDELIFSANYYNTENGPDVYFSGAQLLGNIQFFYKR